MHVIPLVQRQLDIEYTNVKQSGSTPNHQQRRNEQNYLAYADENAIIEIPIFACSAIKDIEVYHWDGYTEQI